VEYRVQFLDRSGSIIKEFHAYARDVAGAMNLIIDVDWPPGAVRLRVVDAEGLEVDGRKAVSDATPSRSCGHRGDAALSYRSHVLVRSRD